MKPTGGRRFFLRSHELVSPHLLAALAVGLVFMAVVAVLNENFEQAAKVRHVKVVEALDDYFEKNDCTVITYTSTRLQHAETVLCLKGPLAGTVVPFERVRQPVVKTVLARARD